MKIAPLPPLNSLVPFEAAARLLSFTRAAEELSVTQSAVSRQVRLLETYLGIPLFDRVSRTIRLTPTGVQLFRCVHQALLEVARTTSEIRRPHGDLRVTVATTSAMASLWLLPRIGSFRRDNDDVDLRIVASDQVRDLRRLECDVALYYCRVPPADANVTPLFPEEIFPVCSPGYLAQVDTLQTVEDLQRCTLLHLVDADIDWITWPGWFRSLGIAPNGPGKRLDINNYPMLLQAAVMDQGVALGWSHLVDDLLQSGALLRPIDTVLRTTAQFSLIEPQSDGNGRACVRRFRDWLMRQIPTTVGNLGLS